MAKFTQVIFRGTRADQPLATNTSPGSLYYVTDEQVTERVSDDGTTWEDFTDAGGGGGGGVAIAAGTQTATTSTIVFSNSNGITFGMSGSTRITASHNGLTTAMASNRGSDFVQATAVFNGTNASGTIASGAISVSVGNYITTARASTDAVGLNTAQTNVTWTVNSSGISLNASRYAGTGLTTTTTAGTAIVGTNNTLGLSLGIPAYLTVAGGGANINISAGTTSNNLTAVTFDDANGVSFGLNGSVVTATVATNYQSQGAYLTTAMASNRGSDFVQATAVFNGTNASGTIASGAISVSVGNYITTGALSGDTTKYVQAWELTGNTAGTTSSLQGTKIYFQGGNGLTVSGSSNSVVFSVGNYLTTAMASNRASDFVQATAAFNGTNASGTIASGAISVSVGNYITTARASTDAIGLNTAQSNVTWTVNSSGLSFDARGYAGTGTSATNATFTLNSNGLALSVGAGGAEANNIVLTGNTAGDTTASGASIAWSGGNGVTLSGTNGSVVGIAVSTYSTVGTATTVYPVASANSVGTVTRWAAEDHRHAGIGTVMASYWANFPYVAMISGASAITQTSGSSIFLQPFFLPYAVSGSYVRLLASLNDSAVGTAGTTVNNSTFSVDRYTTIGLVLYSQGTGASSRSIQSISSTSAGITGRTIYGGGAQGSRYTVTLAKTYPQSGFATNNYTTSYAVSSGSIVISSNSNTLFTGLQFLDVPWATSIGPGNYWWGVGASTSSASNSANISFAGTAAMPLSLIGLSQSNISVGAFGAVTAASDNQLFIGNGVWTTNASGFSKDSIGVNSVSQVVSNPLLPFQIIRQA